EIGRGSKSAVPGYTGNRQSRASQGIPRFACNPDLNHAAECQAAIVVALERMNGREMRRPGVSRRQLFETIERPVMQSLPEQDYEYAEWRFARVGIDGVVQIRVTRETRNP